MTAVLGILRRMSRQQLLKAEKILDDVYWEGSYCQNCDFCTGLSQEPDGREVRGCDVVNRFERGPGSEMVFECPGVQAELEKEES